MIAITYECPNCHQHSGHAENCPSWYDTEPPAPRAGERDAAPKLIDQLLDAAIYADDIGRRVNARVTIAKQHATLVEQRDRLLRLLRPVTSPTACYCAVMKGEKCWHCEARELIATIEPETEVKSNTSGEAGR